MEMPLFMLPDQISAFFSQRGDIQQNFDSNRVSFKELVYVREQVIDE